MRLYKKCLQSVCKVFAKCYLGHFAEVSIDMLHIVSLFSDGFLNCLVHQTKAYEILFLMVSHFFQSYRFPHKYTGSKLGVLHHLPALILGFFGRKKIV
jgi:hypothetical protein